VTTRRFSPTNERLETRRRRYAAQPVRGRRSLGGNLSGGIYRAARRRVWVTRVLLLREAFLIQMNDFDRLLEFQLQRMLDPVVASRVPPRRGDNTRKSAFFLLVAPASRELASEKIGAVDSVVVTVPRPAGLLP
jgi:hypothetical protein